MACSERIRDNLSLAQIEKLIKKLKPWGFKISKPESDFFVYIEIKNTENLDEESYFPLCFIDSRYDGNYHVELLNINNLFLKYYHMKIRGICNSL